MSAFPRVLPVGDSAVTVELGDAISTGTSARVRALDGALARQPVPGLRETVPAYGSLLVVYDPRAASFDEVRNALLARVPESDVIDGTGGRLVTIPVVYGGDAGPDLADVARRARLSEAEVVALHTSNEYTAFMLGFLPGFAYLGLLPPEIETPRRATPRPRVPAGSVGLAGRQTAVYPTATPGGWNLIGRTSLRLFDAWADPPALICPGDLVRFVQVAELTEVPAPARRTSAAEGEPAVEVLEPGLLTTVQDAGRFGYRRLGVAWAGPMDAVSHATANRAVGNAAGAAALECTVAGPALRVLRPVRLAVAGGDLGAVLHRADLGPWPVPAGVAVLARAGNVLAFTGRRSGCRAYVALAGGIGVPAILGSRSTDVSGGFGGLDGRALRAGDLIRVGPPNAAAADSRAPTHWVGGTTVTVRVVLGPQDGHLSPDSVERFLSEAWAVAPTSDRIGCRLDGAPLTHRGPAEIVTDGMVPGSIQVPPDGRPIVMMADGPTTGGYPKVATVVTADLARLAQLLPGEGCVRFEAVRPGDI